MGPFGCVRRAWGRPGIPGLAQALSRTRTNRYRVLMLPDRIRNTIIEAAKIRDYLLNPEHPDNGGKAAFFARLGFNRSNWHDLAMALESNLLDSRGLTPVESPHGTKYVVDAYIQAPKGGAAWVRSVWIVDRGQDAARLVTAYPDPKRGER